MRFSIGFIHEADVCMYVCPVLLAASGTVLSRTSAYTYAGDFELTGTEKCCKSVLNSPFRQYRPDPELLEATEKTAFGLGRFG